MTENFLFSPRLRQLLEKKDEHEEVAVLLLYSVLDDPIRQSRQAVSFFSPSNQAIKKLLSMTTQTAVKKTRMFKDVVKKRAFVVPEAEIVLHCRNARQRL